MEIVKSFKRYSILLFSTLVVGLIIILLTIVITLSNQNYRYELRIGNLQHISASQQTLEEANQETELLKKSIQYNQTIVNVSLGIATSLLASLIFAYAYSWIVERYNLRFISIEVAERVQEAVYQQVKEKFIDIVPDDYYPSTNEPDTRFNETILQNLVSSQLYLFRGVTGRHIPSLLQKLNYPSFTTLKILLLDPRNEGYIYSYCEERYGPNFQDASNDLVEEVRKEIKDTIVGLFAISQKIPLQIGFHQGPIFYRTEIFDEIILISYFVGTKTSPYPPTYQYIKKSIYYEAFLKDFNQSFRNTGLKISLDDKSSEAELMRFLDSM